MAKELLRNLAHLRQAMKAAGQLALQVMLILGLVVLKFYIFAGGESRILVGSLTMHGKYVELSLELRIPTKSTREGLRPLTALMC